MNQLQKMERRDAKPTGVENEGKELKLISVEPVSFSQWARFMAFKSENVEVENTDFLIVTSSSLFALKKLYRKIPIMVFQKKNEKRYALLQGQPSMEFIRTGDGAGYEGTFNYVVSTEGHVGYVVKYNPEWDEIKGPEIIGNNPMKASCVDELYIEEKDFVFQAGRRLRTGDYCCSENSSGILKKAQTLLGKVKGGREVNISEAWIAKSGRLCNGSISFQVKGTSLQKGVQIITTMDGRTGYNIINKNDVGFLF